MTLPVNLPKAVKEYYELWKDAKTHSLSLSLTLPNDHLCWDLSGHCTLHCTISGQPWPALVSFLICSPHLRSQCQKREPLEVRGLPLPTASMLFHCPVSTQDKNFYCWATHFLSGLFSQSELVSLLVPMLSSCFSNPRVLPVTRSNEELAMTAVSELWELICTIKNNPNSF